jgi:4-alpha-glucanotransferase
LKVIVLAAQPIFPPGFHKTEIIGTIGRKLYLFDHSDDLMELTERTSGVLLHLSSLPGPAFCGDLGESARNFADFLHNAGQHWWQMLPVNPIDSHFSPYSSVSAFAGEPLYLDLVDLIQDGLLEPGDIDWQPPDPLGRTAFQAARDYRKVRWRKAFERFRSGEGGKKYRAAYEPFMKENREWVMRYAIFCSLAEQFGTYHWSLWPDEKTRQADPETLKQVCLEKEE